jgi:uncharacterized protein (DUF1697 family)
MPRRFPVPAAVLRSGGVTSYVALLRGINVGRNKRVAMADLRALLEGLGYTEVRTLLQSGNAVFRSSARKPEKVAAAIEHAIADELGLTVRVLVRRGEELSAIIAAHPLAAVADNGSRMIVHFLSADPDRALLKTHDPLAVDPGHAHLGVGVVYQWCPNGILEAPDVTGALEKTFGLTVTTRNWNTVTKLAAMLDT